MGGGGGGEVMLRLLLLLMMTFGTQFITVIRILYTSPLTLH